MPLTAYFEITETHRPYIRWFFIQTGGYGVATADFYVYKIERPAKWLSPSTWNNNVRSYSVGLVKGKTYTANIYTFGVIGRSNAQESVSYTVTNIFLGDEQQVISKNSGLSNTTEANINRAFFKRTSYTFTADNDYNSFNVYNNSTAAPIYVEIVPSLIDITNGIKAISSMDNSYTFPNAYSGEKINIKPYYYDFENVHSLTNYDSHAVQGMAIYNGYMFQLYDQGYCQIFDLTNYTIVSSFALGSNVTTNHCGNACFGNKFFDGNVDFPALYVSGDLTNFCCYVENITSVGSTLAQKISFMPIKTEFNYNGGACFVDNETDKIYFMQRVNSSISADSNTMKIFEFKLPDLTEGTDNDGVLEIEFSSSDAIRVFDLPVWQKYYQDGIVYKGKLYQISGMSNLPTFLNVYDIASASLLTSIDLTAVSNNDEPEGVDIYNGEMFISFGNYLAKLNF